LRAPWSGWRDHCFLDIENASRLEVRLARKILFAPPLPLEPIMVNLHLVAALAVTGLSLVGCTGDRADRPDMAEATSSRRLKEEITYVSASELQQLKEEVVKVRLATFRYKQGDKGRHLGFIIEDSPGIPASDMPRSRVDLYAYTSMAVAALQVQARQIEQLEADVDVLSNEVERLVGPRPVCGLSSSMRAGAAPIPEAAPQ
jgi:hypothetical protein